MWWIHVKHDNCQDQKGGTTGKSRMSIGPFSKKAGRAALNELRMEHRTLHAFKSKWVMCILRLEREPLSV